MPSIAALLLGTSVALLFWTALDVAAPARLASAYLWCTGAPSPKPPADPRCPCGRC